MPPCRTSAALTPPAARAASPAEAILLAVTGESPAILTETVWALAREKPAPILPARVVVVTTTVGATRLETELLVPSPQFGDRSPWQALRDELLAGRPDADRLLVLEPARIITGRADHAGRARPLDDLRTRDDADDAADFILEQVRAITANADTRLIASIAGGRKTMGALLYAAMTLVGRETDRLTHVLVNAPFDQRLQPPFYFPPKKPARHLLRSPDGSETAHRSSAARIELADVPFVPLRNGFEELRAPVGGFAGLVARYSGALRELAEPPVVTFDPGSHAVRFDGQPVRLENAVQLEILKLLFHLQDALRADPISFKQFAEIVRAAHTGTCHLKGYDAAPAMAIADKVRLTTAPTPPPRWATDGDLHHTVTRALAILRKRVAAVCPRWRPAPRTLLLPPFRLG